MGDINPLTINQNISTLSVSSSDSPEQNYFQYMPVSTDQNSRNSSMFELNKVKPYGKVNIFKSIQNPERKKSKMFLRYKMDRVQLPNKSNIMKSNLRLKPLKRL
mmetsp:Transcript_11463/g.10125  ORF Transcript_11463/g.10125 Transcript_11463/m.10125 type:complete len:104 (-) Transcript_11463:3-314(-)